MRSIDIFFLFTMRKETMLVLTLIMAFAISFQQALSHEGHTNEPSASGSSVPEPLSVDEQSQRALGLATETVRIGSITSLLTTTGEVKADESRAFDVTTQVSGVAQSVNVQKGDTVKKGDVLAVIHSVEVADELTKLLHAQHEGEAKITRTDTEFTSQIEIQEKEVELAKENLDRQESLLAEGITSRKNYLEAKTTYEKAKVKLNTLKKRKVQELTTLKQHLTVTIKTAKDQLRIMGMTGGSIESALKTGRVTANLNIVSPVDGVVTTREITVGERIDPTQDVFKIVDLSPIWVTIDVFQEQLPDVKVGQKATITTPANQTVTGRISNVGTVVDPQRKTIVVRIVSENKGAVLRPGMFVNAEIDTGKEEKKDKIVIPSQAIVEAGGNHYVYLKRGNNFNPVMIETGIESGNKIAVKEGLKPGDTIVVSGAKQLQAKKLITGSTTLDHNHDAHAAHEEELKGQQRPEVTMILVFIGGILCAGLIGLVWFLSFRKKDDDSQ